MAESVVSSKTPSTVPATELAFRGTGNDSGVGDERLSFTFQLKSLRVRIPEAVPAETEYYIKWVRGRSFKGKLFPVPCPLSIPKEDALMDVPLPGTHQFNFEVTLHPKWKDGSVFVKKTMEILIILRRYTDSSKTTLKSRKNIAEIELDLRTLLHEARVGVRTSCNIPFDDTSTYEYLSADYTVVPVDENRSQDAMPSAAVVPKRGTLVSTRLQPMKVGDEEEVLNVIESCLREVAWENGLKGKKEEFSRLEDVMGSELYRIVDSPKALEETWTLLFGSSQYKEQLHKLRGDRGYLDPGWNLSLDLSSGWSVVSYQVRMGGETFYQAHEKSVFCAAGREIIAHSTTTIPAAPIIGDCSYMEYVVHLRETDDGTGTIVALYGNIVINSAAGRALADAKAKKSIGKVLNVSVEVVKSLLGESRRQTGPTRARESRFRRSLTFRPAVMHASLEPNLWYRVVDKNTLPHVHLVLQYLRRIQEAHPCSQSKAVKERILILENVLVYHRHVVQIVRCCCQLIEVFLKNFPTQTIFQCSPTLAPTLRSIFELHENIFGEFEPIILKLEKEMDSYLDGKRQSLLKERNYWHALERLCADEQDVEMCLDGVVHGNSTLMNSTHVDILARTLSLHLGNEGIVNTVMQILVRGRLNNEELTFTQDMIQAIHAACRLYPSLWARYPDLLRSVRQDQNALSAFDKRFGHVVPEPAVYKCRILRFDPKVRTGFLYLTEHFLVIDQTVIDFSNIVSIVQRWKMLQPLVEVTVRQTRASTRTSGGSSFAGSDSTTLGHSSASSSSTLVGGPPSGLQQKTVSFKGGHRSGSYSEATVSTYQFSVWSRKELLEEICNLGYFSLVKETPK